MENSGLLCAVSSCKSSRRKNPERKFFIFPSEQGMFKVWLNKCGLSERNVPKRLHICDKHFNPDCIGKRRLKRNSFPELYLTYPDLKLDQETPLRYQNIKTYSNNIVPINEDMSLVDCIEQSNDLELPLQDNNSDGPSCISCETHIKNAYFYKQKHDNALQKITSLKRRIKNLNRNVINIKKRLKISQQNRKIVSVSKPKSFCNVVDKLSLISPEAKEFIKMLINVSKQWSLEHKNIAQKIYFKSPSCYNFLRENLKLHLPSKSSLCRWTLIKNLKPGLNSFVLNSLKDEVCEMSETDKNIVLLFDEISIRPDLEYDQVNDVIDGFSQINKNRNSTIAQYINVFMIRGLFKQYKYAFAYHATEKSMDGEVTKEVLMEAIKALFDVGFKVRAVVCDQGPNNRKCFRLLNVSKENPFFFYENYKIFALYDSPHLFKSARNNLLSCNLDTPDGTATWKVPTEIFESEKFKTTKLCPKITAQHIYPNNFQKMRVKYATQIFSRTVAAGIKTMIDFNIFSDESKSNAASTASFFEKFDRLFDNLNSKLLYDPNPHKSALKKCNVVHVNLNFMLEYLDTIKSSPKKTMYCFNGLIQTIRGILLLLDSIEEENTKTDFILTSRLNQDPLENFFSIIRQSGGNNHNPSVHEFSKTISKLMTMKFLDNSPSANCENDNDELLMSTISTYSPNESDGNNEENNSNTNAIAKTFNDELDLVIMATEQNYDESLDDASIRYFTGYVAHKILKTNNCCSCRNNLIKLDDKIEMKSENFLFYKNYTKNSQFGSLHAPTEFFFRISKLHIDIFSNIFKKQPQIYNIKQYISEVCLMRTNACESFNSWFSKDNPCYEHNCKILDFTILVLLRKHCKWRTKKFHGLKKPYIKK